MYYVEKNQITGKVFEATSRGPGAQQAN